MTELAITPNYEKKRLELAGTVAAGEHVAVTIVGGGAWIGTGKALRLRVICGARTVAKFPLWTEDNAEDWPEDVTSADAWDSANEGADATCVLNLNTVPAVKLLRFGGMCLWVLDDAENHTLYGSGEYIVEPWPKERGEDEPYYLDEYPDIVAELGERINAVEKSISDAVDEANGIVAYVTAARNDAQSAAQIAGTARNGAQTAQGKAEDAQTAAEAAQVAAEAALPLDTTLATEGKAADAKAVGDAIALKADKSTTYTKSETYTKIETTNAISSAIATVVDSAPEAFDTLKEIADWIEDDQSGAAAMAAAIKGKVDKVSGKGLSANDYTDAEKSKLAGIAAGAQVNPTPIAPANATESGMFADAYWTKQDLADKADKVANATAGNLATLDENGNLADSGKAIGDFALAASLAPAVVPYHAYEVGDLCTSFDNDENHRGTWLYKCILATDGYHPTWPETDPTHWALATVEDLLAALRTALAGKADASSLAPVATSGNYDDLRGKPGNVSAFANDAGYLVASSAAPAFSSDSAVQYAVGSRCTYNGKLYKCTTATTGGTWVAGNWAEDTMTDPDAVLDITAQNRFRVVAKDGTLLWAQGYDLASASSVTLACDAVNNFTFADGATTQAFVLPAAPTGKVGDFGLDIDNSANASAATMTFTGLDTAFSVVVPKGKSLNDMLAIAAGELARFYITLSTFRVNNLPTWHIAKQVVENGGATA